MIKNSEIVQNGPFWEKEKKISNVKYSCLTFLLLPCVLGSICHSQRHCATEKNITGEGFISIFN